MSPDGGGLDAQERQRLADDLRVTRKELTETVNQLMNVTDRLVELIIELIRVIG